MAYKTLFVDCLMKVLVLVRQFAWSIQYLIRENGMRASVVSQPATVKTNYFSHCVTIGALSRTRCVKLLRTFAGISVVMFTL